MKTSRDAVDATASTRPLVSGEIIAAEFAAARSSLSAPHITILSASSGNGRSTFLTLTRHLQIADH
jgi:hypothetical protein